VKIYTRTGDDGTTGLFGGARVKKGALRVEAYGTVDETNAAIGRARVSLAGSAIDAVLAPIQEDLFTLGAELATVPGKERDLKMTLISAEDGARLEREIDNAEEGLPPLKTFVLPGGTPAAADLHLARCIARRAERLLVTLADAEPVRNECIIYLNRLSDLLFTLARRANHLAGVADVPWIGRGR
jgi:cob(I)alamin adenosyltransferase